MKTATVSKAIKAVWTIFVTSWLVRDFSEIEDDDGSERTKEVFFVTAETEDGLVYRHDVTFPSYEAAEVLAARVRGASGWNGPLKNLHWAYFRTIYGSAAYARNWQRLEAETELAERVPELGARAFDSLPDVMKAVLG